MRSALRWRLPDWRARQGAARLLAWLPAFAAAFLVLNTLITFENRWPTVWIRFGQRLSFELCVGVAALMLWVAWRGRAGRLLVGALAALYTALVLTRYGDVTVPVLLGRPVNVYWDGQHLWQALRLAASSAPDWQVASVAAALLLVLAAVYGLAYWAIGSLARTLAWPAPRPWLLAIVLALTASFAAYPHVGRDTRWFFSLPVYPTIVRQALLLPAALAPGAADLRLSPGPRFDTDLYCLAGADLVLVFAEAYGVVTFEQPQHVDALAPARAALLRVLAGSGRQVVSARVQAPTFGRSSWLTHAALLAGVDTREPGHYELLMTTRRGTLASHFAAHGYRTVGWMPGLQRPWPEGAFYGFDRLANADTVGYLGRYFGYWRVPDQASMALLHAQELTERAGRAPRFAVFPTVSSHAPFRPLAPYVHDWERLLRADAFSDEQLALALAEPVSWQSTTPAYIESMQYMLDWLAGYLAGSAPRDLVLLIVGDHQPLASITGRDAAWDVPVHIITGNPELHARLRGHGFAAGLAPPPATLSRMHELTSVLLQAFDGCGDATSAHGSPPP